MSTVIKVENLSKKYILHHQGQEHYLALRDVIANKARNILNPNKIKHNQEEFWALKDLNFEVKQGDRVGIIGRNGAGKSTLLKILSRITEPTTGKIKLKGRVASLLEVGTGFHPELTGRENIFLNGAILGMSKWEIKKKFDEIVSFAEVEKFLDTPVKRYSSGMYVRLAFSVAAHLEPEILIVDEVLAVGDAQFQKKCLGRIEEVGKEGRTVLFVSHNMNAVEKICNEAIFLKDGMLINENLSIGDKIKRYLGDSIDGGTSSWKNINNQYLNEYFHINECYIEDGEGNIIHGSVSNNSQHYLVIEGHIEKLDSSLTIGYCVYNENNIPIYWSYPTDIEEEKWIKFKKGRNVLVNKLPKRLLNEGVYRLEIIGGLHFKKWIFEPGKSPYIYFEISGGMSDSPLMYAKRPTILAPILEWENKCD